MAKMVPEIVKRTGTLNRHLRVGRNMDPNLKNVQFLVTV